MSFVVFTVKNLHHKNGIWWFTKLFNKIVGQETYDFARVYRRVLSNKFYYLRQEMLYRCFIETPDLANLLGIYPKMDSSHGFGFYNTYEMYRDFQENTINSDGAFGMWIAYISAIYLIHQAYNYFLPFYWFKSSPKKNGEQQVFRMRDALASTGVQQTGGMQIAEFGFLPHDYHSLRRRLSQGLSHPDDVRAMAMSAINRRHRYIQHYRYRVGDDQTRMLGF